VLLQELKDFMKLVAKKHQVFIDSVIVNLVPMQICDVKECLKPRLLSVDPVHLADLCEELCYLLRELALILWLVRVPEAYLG
jgi:hypothetical protein